MSTCRASLPSSIRRRSARRNLAPTPRAGPCASGESTRSVSGARAAVRPAKWHRRVCAIGLVPCSLAARRPPGGPVIAHAQHHHTHLSRRPREKPWQFNIAYCIFYSSRAQNASNRFPCEPEWPTSRAQACRTHPSVCSGSTASASLPEVHATVATSQGRLTGGCFRAGHGLGRRHDPSTSATEIAGGARFGHTLLSSSAVAEKASPDASPPARDSLHGEGPSARSSPASSGKGCSADRALAASDMPAMGHGGHGDRGRSDRRQPGRRHGRPCARTASTRLAILTDFDYGTLTTEPGRPAGARMDRHGDRPRDRDRARG